MFSRRQSFPFIANKEQLRRQGVCILFLFWFTLILANFSFIKFEFQFIILDLGCQLMTNEDKKHTTISIIKF